MPARAFKFRRVVPLLILGGLAGCGPGVNEFPPACPTSAILGDAADLTRYDGKGRDLTDLVLSGRVEALQGTCKDAGAGQLAASVRVGINLTRGPAAPGRDAEIRYFVAVTREQTILDKQVFVTQVSFPANTDQLHLTSEPVDLTMPVPDGLSGKAYRVIIGFQLSPEELAFNRAHSPN